jgi:hypothetical protein
MSPREDFSTPTYAIVSENADRARIALASGSRLYCSRSMPSLRSSTIADLRQRVVSGENGSMNGIPFALRSGFPSRSTR